MDGVFAEPAGNGPRKPQVLTEESSLPHGSANLRNRSAVLYFNPGADIGGREFEGVLTGWDAETVTLVIEPSTGSAGKKKKGKEEQTGTADGPRTVIVPRKEIAVIRLYLDI